MYKKICMGILVFITLAICCASGCARTTFDKSNPIQFEQRTNGEYAYIVYNGGEYAPYAAIDPKERGEYLGYIGSDPKDEVYTFHGHAREEWLINYLDSGMMNDCVLLKEKSVSDIPDGLHSDYAWNTIPKESNS